MAHLNNRIVCFWASVMILLMDQATGCDVSEINQCMSTLGPPGSIHFYGIPPSSSFKTDCSKLGLFQKCAQRLRDNCPDKRLPDPISRFLYAVASTMCDSFLQDVLANANCWDKPDVQARFKSCATSTLVSTCSDSQKVNSCMGDAVRSNCGQEQVTVLEKILQPTAEAMLYPATCDQATGCDVSEINQCMSTLGPPGSIHFYGIPPSSSFKTDCSKLGLFQKCAQRLRDNCPDKRLPDPISRFLYAVASTMCDSFLQDVLANANCWDKPDVQARFKSCATSTLVSTCSDSQKVNSCMGDAVRSNCGQEQVTVLEKILQPTAEAMLYPATCGTGHLKSQCMVVFAALFVLKYVFRIL